MKIKYIFMLTELLKASLLLAVLSVGAFGQSSSPQMINVFFEYGKADYLDLSGKTVFSARNTLPQKNLESWVIGYKAWNLVGDYVYNPSFYYAVDREKLIGKTRTVQFSIISKYPDLAKRYQAIRPSSVNIVITALLHNRENGSNWVYFKVSQNDLQYFGSRSGKNLQNPVSPSSGKWKYVFSTDSGRNQFTDADSSDEKWLKAMLKTYQHLSPGSGTSTFSIGLDIKWADDAIDEIGRLYDQYEKENKKIDGELKDIKEADKLVKPVAAYNKDDEMSAPFEEEAKSAEVFKDGETVGLRAKGKIVFQSSEYYNAEPLNSEKNLFKLRSRKGDFHLYNAKGKQISVDGNFAFHTIKDGKQSGTYYLFVLLEKKFYTTKQLYSGYMGFLTQPEFDRFVADDKTPRRAPSEYKEGTVYLTADSRVDFSRGTLYTVDEKLQIISKETAYY